jgi:transglutaminase-like putative cysteine protease
VARINVIHTTEYEYRNPVGLLRHRLMVRPDDSHDLRLHRATLDVEPAPSKIHWKHDVFDNSICFLEWPEHLTTKRLSIVSSLDMTHHPDGPPAPVYSLDAAAETFPFSYSQEESFDLAPLVEPETPDEGGKVAAWIRRVVSEAGTNRTLAVLEAITHSIKQEFRYGARYEHGVQSAAETLALGTGTCRDFAILMMEALRSYGIAARFVTGYLYDDLSGATRGGGATHAWCSIYIPGAGWVEYDPTNGLVAGSNLIRVGATRTAAQASPISGGFVGGAGDALGMRVDVSVTAAAL